MHKLVYVVWDRRGREARRRVLLGEVAPRLLDAGVLRLGVDVADDHAAVPAPTPFPLGAERPTGLVNAWVPSAAAGAQPGGGSRQSPARARTGSRRHRRSDAGELQCGVTGLTSGLSRSNHQTGRRDRPGTAPREHMTYDVFADVNLKFRPRQVMTVDPCAG